MGNKTGCMNAKKWRYATGLFPVVKRLQRLPCGEHFRLDPKMAA